MMGLWWCLKQCFYAFIILILALLYVPGIPPHLEFSAYTLEPVMPREGPLQKNTILDKAERLHEGKLFGPESIASRARNEIFVGLKNGDIVRVYGHKFEKIEFVTNLKPGCGSRGDLDNVRCGRPLGLRFTKDKKLLIVDAYLGIYSHDLREGTTELLVDAKKPIEGKVPMLPDDVDWDEEGNLYWSDASTIATLDNSVMELLADASGRLLKYDPVTRRSSVLMSNLHFANGVQMSADKTFLLVAETMRSRIHRYWLKGPKAGKSDIFVSGLPGTPDNIRSNGATGFYVSLVSTRPDEGFDLLPTVARLPRLRKAIARATTIIKNLVDFINSYYTNELLNLGVLGQWLERNETLVVELDEGGRVISSLRGSSGKLMKISETARVGDYLFFGSPWVDWLGKIHIDKAVAESIPQKKSSAKEEL